MTGTSNLHEIRCDRLDPHGVLQVRRHRPTATVSSRRHEHEVFKLLSNLQRPAARRWPRLCDSRCPTFPEPKHVDPARILPRICESLQTRISGRPA